jgi:hypothetical protein
MFVDVQVSAFVRDFLHVGHNILLSNLFLREVRHCATSRKVAGSIPDCHWNFFIDLTSGRTIELGSTQPPIEMSISNISYGVKAAGAYG